METPKLLSGQWAFHSRDGRVFPQIYIGRLPGRKQMCLTLIQNSGFKPIAYFRQVEDAEYMIELLNLLAKPQGAVIE